MTSEVGKPAHSGEEVLALKKYISKCNLDNEKLKEAIAVNKNRTDFLVRFRCVYMSRSMQGDCVVNCSSFSIQRSSG